MFQPEAIELRQFYSSALGQRVMRYVAGAVYRLWPGCRGETVAGLGYCLPYLHLLGEADGLLSLMPREQGAIYWPAGGNNATSLVDAQAHPLADHSLNRLLVVHALEHAHHAATILKEAWRVMVPGGRMLVVVPNRRGIWAQAAETPFGCGQPYTLGQLKHRAGLVGFTWVQGFSALYLPPLGWRWLLALSWPIELLGRMFLPGAGGVLVVELEKQIYASIPEPVKQAKGSRMAMPVGMAG